MDVAVVDSDASGAHDVGSGQDFVAPVRAEGQASVVIGDVDSVTGAVGRGGLGMPVTGCDVDGSTCSGS